MSPNVLVVGGGRGLGLGLIRQLAAREDTKQGHIFCATRSTPIEGLQDIIDASKGHVHHVQMDVNIRTSIKDGVDQIESLLGDGNGLDLLINCVGKITFCLNGMQEMDDLDEIFKINVTTAHWTTQTCLPLLDKANGKKVVNISSFYGSIANAHLNKDPCPAYNITKCALNMLTKQYALSMGDRGYTFVAIHPGWVKTDMGSDRADLHADEASKAVLKVALDEGKESNGRFRNVEVKGWEDKEGMSRYDGVDVAW